MRSMLIVAADAAGLSGCYYDAYAGAYYSFPPYPYPFAYPDPYRPPYPYPNPGPLPPANPNAPIHSKCRCHRLIRSKCPLRGFRVTSLVRTLATRRRPSRMLLRTPKAQQNLGSVGPHAVWPTGGVPISLGPTGLVPPRWLFRQRASGSSWSDWCPVIGRVPAGSAGRLDYRRTGSAPRVQHGAGGVHVARGLCPYSMSPSLRPAFGSSGLASPT
jgi:hypothetical protein